MFVLVSFQVFPQPRFSLEVGFYEYPRDGLPRRLVSFHLGWGSRLAILGYLGVTNKEDDKV